jgi:glutathionyl-hydroquinone reductase
LILAEPVISVIRRELRKLDDGLRVDLLEVERIVRKEVLKREIIEGDEAHSASARISKLYKKKSAGYARKSTISKAPVTHLNVKPKESVTERLLRESEEDEKDS